MHFLKACIHVSSINIFENNCLITQLLTLINVHFVCQSQQWFVDHPTFQNNQFYVGADSYAGIIAPMIVHEIYNGIIHTWSISYIVFFEKHKFYYLKCKNHLVSIVLNGDEHLIRVLSVEIISANFKTEIETDVSGFCFGS